MIIISHIFACLFWMSGYYHVYSQVNSVTIKPWGHNFLDCLFRTQFVYSCVHNYCKQVKSQWDTFWSIFIYPAIIVCYSGINFALFNSGWIRISVEKASKKIWNLGFWLKLGVGGVWRGSMSPTCYQVFFYCLKVI